MQTFILFKSQQSTMKVLDNVRLARQRMDVLKILKTIMDDDEQYRNHPAVRMWREFPEALVMYGLHVVHEYRIERGHEDKTWGDLAIAAHNLGLVGDPKKLKLKKVRWPAWSLDEEVMRSHRSRLIHVAPHIYGPEFPDTPENMPFLWPQIIRSGEYRLRLSDEDIILMEQGKRQLPDHLVWNEHKREVIKVEGQP